MEEVVEVAPTSAPATGSNSENVQGGAAASNSGEVVGQSAGNWPMSRRRHGRKSREIVDHRHALGEEPRLGSDELEAAAASETESVSLQTCRQ